MFVDLKAAFDNVYKEKLWEIIKKKGIESDIIRRIRKIYEETELTIRTKDGLTRNFNTKKGVRQEYVLSPVLFNLYVVDLDEALERRNIERVELGKSRIWSLVYADDMVLVAKNKDALKDMLKALKRFLKDRKLELNAEQTKISVQ